MVGRVPRRRQRDKVNTGGESDVLVVADWPMRRHKT